MLGLAQAQQVPALMLRVFRMGLEQLRALWLVRRLELTLEFELALALLVFPARLQQLERMQLVRLEQMVL